MEYQDFMNDVERGISPLSDSTSSGSMSRVVCLFGPPGSGKSALCKAMGGLDLEGFSSMKKKIKALRDAIARRSKERLTVIGMADVPSSLLPEGVTKLQLSMADSVYFARRAVRDLEDPSKADQPKVTISDWKVEGATPIEAGGTIDQTVDNIKSAVLNGHNLDTLSKIDVDADDDYVLAVYKDGKPGITGGTKYNRDRFIESVKSVCENFGEEDGEKKAEFLNFVGSAFRIPYPADASTDVNEYLKTIPKEVTPDEAGIQLAPMKFSTNFPRQTPDESLSSVTYVPGDDENDQLPELKINKENQWSPSNMSLCMQALKTQVRPTDRTKLLNIINGALDDLGLDPAKTWEEGVDKLSNVDTLSSITGSRFKDSLAKSVVSKDNPCPKYTLPVDNGSLTESEVDEMLKGELSDTEDVDE